MRITYLTAGAAGMYCGSCMHDNTLAAALHGLGVDVQLIPTYTPVRTDEHDVSVDQVFFGGINVYLQQKIPLFRHLPLLLDRFLNRPKLLRWATSRALSIDPRLLGSLTVSMLQGEQGYQRKEVRRLCRHLAAEPHPDVLVLTNILIGGCIPAIKRTLGKPLLVTLQGDDVFLDSLHEPHRTQAREQIRRLVRDIDGFLVHSDYYARRMQQMFQIPAERMHCVPLGIDLRDFGDRLPPGPPPAESDSAGPGRQRTVGYLARLAPEKGLHLLVDAFLQLRQASDMGDVQLAIAGWLGEHQRSYAEQAFSRLRQAGLTDAFRYEGSLNRQDKIRFLRRLDVLSVPTTYEEPKGLYVLEAMAAGVPVVQPAHGAFPELIQTTGGGLLVEPGRADLLAEAWADLLRNHDRRWALARAGQRAVHESRNAREMAADTLAVLSKYVEPG